MSQIRGKNQNIIEIAEEMFRNNRDDNGINTKEENEQSNGSTHDQINQSENNNPENEVKNENNNNDQVVNKNEDNNINNNNDQVVNKNEDNNENNNKEQEDNKNEDNNINNNNDQVVNKNEDNNENNNKDQRDNKSEDNNENNNNDQVVNENEDNNNKDAPNPVLLLNPPPLKNVEMDNKKIIHFINCYEDFIVSNPINLYENTFNYLNIENLLSYDIPHHINYNNEANYNINYNKNNFIEDTMYSELHSFMLEQNTNDFKIKNQFDEVLLNEQIKYNLNPINQLNKDIKKNLIYSIKEYDTADDYTKRYVYNLSPCFESQYLKNIFFDILCYRRARNDSDSFFKCFMFSYLEKCIIYKKKCRIKILINDILMEKKKPFFSRNIKVDENEALYILLIILEYLEHDDIINSINFLNRAFCSNDNFCNTLVKYMKTKLSNFIKEYYKFFNSKEIIDNHIILNKYYNINKEFNYYQYSKEKILLMQTEPDLFIYFITPFVFEIDLRLYTIESHGEKQLALKNLPYSSDFKIDLIYMNKKYLIAYNENYYQNILNYLKYEILDNDIEDKSIRTDMGDDDSIKQINYDDVIEICNSNFKCEKCNTETNEIILKKINPNTKICKNCLKISVDNILNNRFNNLKKDGYENIEYYSRNIQLSDNNEKNKVYLTILEFKFLYGDQSTVLSELLSLVKTSCYLCKNYVEHEELIKMQCGCYICRNCLINIINNYTDNKIILNDDEKLLYKKQKEFPKCFCGEILDIDFVISKIYKEDELKEKKQLVKERLKIDKKICLICQKEFTSNQDNNKEYFNIEIDNNKNSEYENHIICFQCFKKIKINNNKRNKEEFHQIDCKICNKPHKIKFKVIPNARRNTQCTCNIF